MTDVVAMAVPAHGSTPERFEYVLADLGRDEVEIKVESVGLCHSDLSMANNDWGTTTYPFVGGHEVVGTITAAGPNVVGRQVGDRVGLGWISSSPLSDPASMAGRHHEADGTQATIVGRHGGFATHVRCQWAWAIPIPAALDSSSAGPLFCGGITVFQPIVDLGVSPTDRVAVVGIGGLGHLAVKFLAAWGCEVTAFTSQGKADAARELGAHNVVNSRDASTWRPWRRHFDLVLSTVNVPLPWEKLLRTLRPGGVLHSVGMVTEPYDVTTPTLMGGRSLSSSGVGDPATTARMLEFCQRHSIAPTVERLGLSELSVAMERLERGDVHHRFVLDQDLA